MSEAEVDALADDSSRAPVGAIVPAAGRGSRLGHDAPKILYPILGRPLLAWLLDLLEPRCASIVIVVSPSGRPLVESALRDLGSPRSVTLAEQAEPRGMADAVASARDAMKLAHTLVLWGDQVGLAPRTIDRLIRLHRARDKAKLTLATIPRETPYIHVARDAEERIVKVHEARKAPILVPVGENDCGLFAFHTATLFDVLEKARREIVNGDEFDLLPLFPRFEQGPGTVATMRIVDSSETIGINTVNDAASVSAILSRRQVAS